MTDLNLHSMKVNGKFVPENKIFLTSDQEQFVRDNFYSMTNQQIADTLGMKITALRIKMYAMGLKRMELEYWTEEQIDFLVKNYHWLGDKEIAEIFDEKYHKEKGWTRKHIEKKRRYMKLKRTEEMKRSIKAREVAKGTYSIANRRMWQTRGTNPVGTIVVWKHGLSHITQIKSESGKYIHYNRALWIEHHGNIPEGKCVVRKDINLDWTIDNMELISKAENARRNKAQNQALPTELKQIVKINNKLTKKIKQHEKNQLRTNP